MKTIFLLFVLACALINPFNLLAQHEHHQMPMQQKDTSKPVIKHRTARQPMKKPAMNINDTMKMDKHDHEMMMTSAYSLNLLMSRDGSGTSWVPDDSHMYMIMKMNGKAGFMFHGNVFLRYTKQDLFNKGNRGADKFDAPNFFMGMLNRPVGKKGLFTASLMMSLDRLTEGGNGYPLLFQSGETWKGQKLVDRQHPHDLFSALTIGYSYAIDKNMDVYGYLGYPGEPALGPPVFMHRNSAMNNPDAPLGHHWQDATHITFGVATLGFRYKNFKVEGSSFTGREPDEDRYGFDKARFNSYSYRLSYNPTANWALQFSQGFMKEPEALEPGVDITRTTASVLYAKSINANKHYSAALIWGLNDKGEDHKEHSLLLEDNYQFGKNALFSRYEFLQKSTEELDLEDELGHEKFAAHVFSLGYSRSLLQKGFFELAAGTKATINFPAKELKPLYGNIPLGFQVYIQLRPVLHRH